MRNNNYGPCMCGDSECPSCGFAQGTRSFLDPTEQQQVQRLTDRVMERDFVPMALPLHTRIWERLVKEYWALSDIGWLIVLAVIVLGCWVCLK